ncbi:1-deoxy-D-xylulose-5-phosphate reductoisomerase [bacterium]|nr:1-deoxy-D-xylulose-5-phosphate reductoisomerase [bacterium]
MKKRIAILGSTGSIGTQALTVIKEHSDLFDVEVLTAYNNYELLIRQAIECKPNAVVIGNENHYHEVSEALIPHDVHVYAGEEAISQVLEMDTIDLVVMAIVGFGGLKPTLASLKNHKTLALANKESLVIAGEIVSRLALETRTPIIPVDSEHSAIFQCLMGELDNPIEKIMLTASGGPFRGYTKEKLETVTAREALVHPNWNMGDKVTVDSATLMNKGLEAIEAKWLFDLKSAQIEVIIHPQSIVHSLVYFSDSSVKAQLGLPDMRLPIQFALSYPNRLSNSFATLDLIETGSLDFEKPDIENFRNLALAFEAMEKGGNMPCILNAANEVAVEAFLKNQIDFLGIPQIIENCMLKSSFIHKPDLNDYVETDRVVRAKAKEFNNSIR